MLMRSGLALLLTALFLSSASAQREFGFDNRKSSGQPYLKPDETVAKMKVPDGFEVKLFAAEPDLVNPIAYTIDEKGRAWVVESFEYPSKTPVGKMPRDRIVILEDTDGDGKTDKRTVWAEGKDFPVRFDLASGIEVGHGGVFLGAPPYLFFLSDTDGDGKCDKHEILLKGFGAEDTHEMLNTFQWGPDGKLYGLHGVFTQTKIGDVKMNAAVWRYDVKEKKFEIFAEGTSNPWGMDYRNSDGQFILACCVIPHLFHMTHGGIYKRQAGASFNPYAYGLLPEISDHTFHRESGWAHAGLISLDTPLMPEEYRNDVIFGSIHGCSIKRNVLKKKGSTFTASKQTDFLVSGDKNVRPINLRWGPHGDIYVSDWHDIYPCHQTPADAWDYGHGRIYRIQKKGAKVSVPEDLGKKTDLELVALLDDPNPYRWRYAVRLLAERWSKISPDAKAEVTKRLNTYDLRTIWLAGQTNAFAELGEEWIKNGLSEKVSPSVRRWIVTILGEEPKFSEFRFVQMVRLAKTDPSPEVRLAVASVALRYSGKIKVPTLFHALMERKEDANDPVIPFLTWLGYEQILSGGAQEELNWLAENAPGNPFITDHILSKTVRRIASSAEPKDLTICMRFIQRLSDKTLRRKALDGMLLALGNRQMDAPSGWKEARAELMKDADRETQQMLSRLGVIFRDTEALKKALAIAKDESKPTTDRVLAVKDIALGLPIDAVEPLLIISLDSKCVLELRAEAVRALAGYDRPEIAAKWLGAWKDLQPSLRAEIVSVLSGRKPTAVMLLDAMAKKSIARTDVTDSAITRIRAFKDKSLDAQIEKVWGKFRETPEELNTLINKMRDHLDTGKASFARGRKVFEVNCGKCHQFDTIGHEVGPKLDGAERSVEYLLANVLDPNRVIGSPYFVRTVELKNGRVESGLLVEETDQAITLKGENAVIKMILKKDVEEILIVEKSVMPEGLANNMTPQDFRDLIRYVMVNPFITDVTLELAGTIMKPTVGASGRIPLPDVEKRFGAGLKLITTVQSPEARTMKLLIGMPGKLRVVVNGKAVSEVIPMGKTVYPDQIAIDVPLKSGANTIEIYLDYDGKGQFAFMRFQDVDRKLKYSDSE